LRFESVHTEKNHPISFSDSFIYHMDSDGYRIGSQLPNNPPSACPDVGLLQNLSFEEKTSYQREKRISR